MKQKIYQRRHLVTIDLIGFSNDTESRAVYNHYRSEYVHPINGTTRTLYRSIPNGLRFYVFDLYILKELSVLKKYKIYIQKFLRRMAKNKDIHSSIITITNIKPIENEIF